MDKEDLLHYFMDYVPVTAEEVEALLDVAIAREVRKNQFLIRAGEKSSALVLIMSGYLMTYYEDKNADPHVLQFGQKHWWTGDLEAFGSHGPSFYSVRAITDSSVLELSHENFEALCLNYPLFDRFFRIIFQKSLVSHQKRIMRNISSTAEERYEAFTKNYPKLELTVPQKYIASYLGITPEFLSKLRKRRA